MRGSPPDLSWCVKFSSLTPLPIVVFIETLPPAASNAAEQIAALPFFTEKANHSTFALAHRRCRGVCPF